MRVHIKGDEKLIAGLEQQLHWGNILTGCFLPNFMLELRHSTDKAVIVDSLDGELEKELVLWISRLLKHYGAAVKVHLHRSGHVPEHCSILVPSDASEKVIRLVELGIVSALQTIRDRRKPFWKRIFTKKILAPAFAIFLATTALRAQHRPQTPIIKPAPLEQALVEPYARNIRDLQFRQDKLLLKILEYQAEELRLKVQANELDNQIADQIRLSAKEQRVNLDKLVLDLDELKFLMRKK